MYLWLHKKLDLLQRGPTNLLYPLSTHLFPSKSPTPVKTTPRSIMSQINSGGVWSKTLRTVIPITSMAQIWPLLCLRNAPRTLLGNPVGRPSSNLVFLFFSRFRMGRSYGYLHFFGCRLPYQEPVFLRIYFIICSSKHYRQPE